MAVPRYHPAGTVKGLPVLTVLLTLPATHGPASNAKAKTGTSAIANAQTTKLLANFFTSFSFSRLSALVVFELLPGFNPFSPRSPPLVSFEHVSKVSDFTTLHVS